MFQAGIKEAKNSLSRLLTRVKAGEEVVITDRGRPVARIVKEPVEERSFRETLGDLVERGLVVLPSRSIRKDELAVMVEVSGKPVSEMVTEDRLPRNFHHHGQLILPDAAARQHDEPSLHQIPQRFAKRSLLELVVHNVQHFL